MIIEIKNLPTDRKVKKISFDIEFEEGIPATITEVPETFCASEPSAPAEPYCAPEEPEVRERPVKDIPEEMKEQEF